MSRCSHKNCVNVSTTLRTTLVLDNHGEHGGGQIMRVQMPKSEVHLYFTRGEEEVRVVAVWWSRRRRPPSL
jgi:hypothetical protein